MTAKRNYRIGSGTVGDRWVAYWGPARSDAAVAFGDNGGGQTNIPDLQPGVTAAAAAGYRHTVLLRSDGTAVAVGQASIPDLPPGVTYTWGQTSIRDLLPGVTYTAVAAGPTHMVLLASS